MAESHHLMLLKVMMVAHKDLLKDKDGKPRKVKSGGKDVDPKDVEKVIKDLDAAIDSVSTVCQQGLLAIEPEP
jgi:hypothetical protein